MAPYNNPALLMSLLTCLVAGTGCSGGGGGSANRSVETPQNTPETTAPEVTPETPSAPATFEQYVSIERPASLNSNETLRLLGANLYIDQDLGTQTQTVVSRRIMRERLYAINFEGNIELMADAQPDSESVDLTLQSTAIILLGMHPAFARSYTEDPTNFTNVVTAFDEFRALVSVMNRTRDWSKFTDAPFIRAFAKAVIRIYEEMELTIPQARRYQLTSDGQRDLSQIRMNISETADTPTNSFSLNVDNIAERYVAMLVGDKNHREGVNGFMVGPTGTPLEQVTQHYRKQLLQNAESEQTYIYAFGPSLMSGDDSNANKVYTELRNGYATSSREARTLTLYRDASLLSLVDFHLIPFTAAQYGIETQCLRDLWLTKDHNAMPKINLPIDDAYQTSRNYLDQRNYWQVARALYDEIYRNTTASIVKAAKENVAPGKHSDIYGCATGTDSTKPMDEDRARHYQNLLISIFRITSSMASGQVKTFTDIPNLRSFFNFDPRFTRALRQSPKQWRWTLANLHTADSTRLSIEAANPDDTISTASLGSPSSQRTAYKYGFMGECPALTQCKYILFKRDVPNYKRYDINFTVACERGESCRNVIGHFGDGKTDGGTEANPSNPFNGSTLSHRYPYFKARKSYIGTLYAADADGAYGNYPFHLQVAEAQPEIQMRVDGQLLAKGSTPTLEFDCTANDDGSLPSPTKTLSLQNIGLGNLYLKYESLIPGNWSFDQPFVADGNDYETLAPGAALTRTLRYNCNNAAAFTSSFTVSDNFISYRGTRDWTIEIKEK